MTVWDITITVGKYVQVKEMSPQKLTWKAGSQMLK